MRLIGLSGAIGAGKDTVAGILQEIDDTFVALSFKAGMVSSLMDIFELESAELFFNRELKEIPSPRLMGHTPRYVMQTFGTDFIRNKIHEDFFVFRTENKLKKLLPSYGVIVTDVRFANDVEMVKRNGGVIWHIVRPSNPHTSSSHISEHQNIQEFADTVIINEGENLDSLRRIIKSSYATLKNRVDTNRIGR